MLVIQVAAPHRARAWGILVRHSPGTALRDGTFIVSPQAVRALREAGIKVSIISRNGADGQIKGVSARERV